MTNFTGLTRAPLTWKVTFKPTGLCKKTQRFCPEYEISLTAYDRDEAAMRARQQAIAEGFKNYAISKITEVKKFHA